MAHKHLYRVRIIGRRRRVRALTLLECMWALAIVPLAVTSIALAVSAGQSQALELLHQERADTLAENLMEEILSQPYSPDDDDEVIEAQRWLYDHATDYAGFSETASNIKAVDRVGLKEISYPSAYQHFSRSVSLSECECGGGSPACASSDCQMLAVTVTPCAVLTITVTVEENGRTMSELTRVRQAEVTP